MNGLYTILLVMLFWNWFVVPLGVVKISFFWAMGLYLLVNMLLDGVNHFDFNHKDEPLKDFKGYRVDKKNDNIEPGFFMQFGNLN